jgi:hypothetical protein
VFGVKVAFFSCDPWERGRNPGRLAWEMASKTQIHEGLDWSHWMAGCVQQIGRVKEWAGVGCAGQIAESSLGVDDVDLRVTVAQGRLGWSCRFSS